MAQKQHELHRYLANSCKLYILTSHTIGVRKNQIASSGGVGYNPAKVAQPLMS